MCKNFCAIKIDIVYGGGSFRKGKTSFKAFRGGGWKSGWVCVNFHASDFRYCYFSENSVSGVCFADVMSNLRVLCNMY